MALSKRLEGVASLVPSGSFVADVGADHGLLSIYLLEQGIASHVQAIENKKGPFLRLEKAIKSSKVAPKVTLSLSDGLSALDPKVNTVVIAGMGGLLIKKIILAHQETLSHIQFFVIDAHKENPELMETLLSLSYQPVKDLFLYEEGIPYLLYLYQKVEKPVAYSEDELFFGPLAIKEKDPLWIKYWQDEKKRYQTLLDNSLLPMKTKKKYQDIIKKIEVYCS